MLNLIKLIILVIAIQKSIDECKKNKMDPIKSLSTISMVLSSSVSSFSEYLFSNNISKKISYIDEICEQAKDLLSNDNLH